MNYLEYKQQLNQYLEKLSFREAPHQLVESMKYTLLAKGKRLRGVLALASYNLLKGNYSTALPLASALEMIHAYSLIHDDLPCMDNDSLRRGVPTNHIVFGEAMALLSGDALLNYAHQLLLLFLENNFSLNVLKSVQCISNCAGIDGMIAGQAVDINSTNTNDFDELKYIHKHKTSDLIAASVLSGLHFANANANQILAGKAFAYNFGMAFQIIDDILDVIGEEKTLGKTIGKDDKHNKLTWVSMMGIERSKSDAKIYSEKALCSLKQEFKNIDFFEKLTYEFLERIN